jgi:prepilin-type N-terminal cleavage/methylation domain-containing protein
LRVRTTRTRADGFTLVEVVIVAAIVSIMLVISIGGMQQWIRNQKGKEMARQFADVLMVGRAEALRGREPVVIFFNADRTAAPLIGSNGTPVAALAIRDIDGDGNIDAGEEFSEVAYPPPGTISWGHSLATDLALGDPAGVAGSPPTAALTFDQPDGSAATWVAFMPDGTPRAYVNETLAGTGAIGTGAGAIYVTSGSRDYAVVLSPLGTVHIQAWDDSNGRWRR